MGMMDEFESGREWIEEKFDMNKMSGNQERNLKIFRWVNVSSC